MTAGDERAQRAAVVRAARGWIGTPYHHHAAVRGAGVDCARLLIEVFAEAGLIDRFRPAPYPPDWHLHRDEERYVETILRFAAEYDWTPADPPRPGDVVAWRYGRTFSHGAIVTGAPGLAAPDGWPWIVHAFAPSMTVEECRVTGSSMSGRPMRAFSVW